MAMPNYLRTLDRASASINPFLFVLAMGLALTDLSLALHRPGFVEALTSASDDVIVGRLQPDEIQRDPLSPPALMAQLGFD